jgi:hypothetical protein
MVRRLVPVFLLIGTSAPCSGYILAMRVVHHSEHRGDVAIIAGQRLSLHALTQSDPPYA